jgi:hypothetical protein
LSWQNCFVDPAFAEGAMTPAGADAPPLDGGVAVPPVPVAGVVVAGVCAGAAAPPLGVASVVLV